MNLISSFYKFLNTKRFFFVLFFLNVIIGIVVFRVSCGTNFPDSKGYWLMGESILHGKFSSWYLFYKYYPETLRTPGYPAFLAMCQLISSSQLFVKVIQLILYFISVFICTLIIKRVNTDIKYRNIFLLLLLPNIQIVYYSGLISTEIISILFIVLTMFLVCSKRSLRNMLFIAITCYCTFIVRPAFLLFPFILFIYFIIQNKQQYKLSLIFIFFYIALLIPFGLWNKSNHGIFKITTIEGAAGAMHLSYWALKLPDGYTERFYWGNNTSYDLTKPHFYNNDEIIKNVKDYETECKLLWNNLKQFETRNDSLDLVKMSQLNPEIFVLHNSKYNIEREKLLTQITKQHILNDPGYYLKSRTYQLFRTYVTGINYKNLEESNSFLGKIKVIYPFVITFAFIFLGLIFITIKILLKKTHFKNKYGFVLLFWYYGIIHLPFTIQARYSIPVHLLILSILTITIIKEKTYKNG
ncbi:MAG: hypothetical protein HY951_11540 [Bacteroidia bacterium]|nr:hypothetical protein [Bacteroidia bacterium]